MSLDKSGEREREREREMIHAEDRKWVQASDGAPLENILPISFFTESQLSITSKLSFFFFFDIAPTIAVDG